MPIMTERKKPNRKGKSLGAYLPSDLLEAFDRYVEETEPKPSKTAILAMLIRRFLGEKGYWPPPASRESGK